MKERQKLSRQEIFTLIGIAVLVVVAFIGVLPGAWKLTDVLPLVPAILLAGAVGLFVWGFRHRVESWFKPKSSSLVEKKEQDSWSLPPRVFPADLVIEDILVREITEEETGIKQKRFVILVVNKESTNARECRATLTLTKGKEFAQEFRWLIWEGEPPPVEKIIKANDKVYLMVVFSDSRLNGSAMACKFNTLYNDKGARCLQRSKRVMMKDSFEKGDYEALVEVKARDNVSTSAKFRIHVGDSYDELTMERIE